MEPEAEVKLVQNFYYKIYLVCNWEAGKEVLQPAPVNSLRLRRLRVGLSASCPVSVSSAYLLETLRWLNTN